MLRLRCVKTGFETIMVNCNPETVSTDYDTSDRLYFEPLTLEDVMEIIDKEKPVGVIVQYGGQTPLKLCRALEAAGAPIIGTTPDAIDVAEDRERFQTAGNPAWLCGSRRTVLLELKMQRYAPHVKSVIRWWCVLPMCWVDAQWKWCSTKMICALT